MRFVSKFPLNLWEPQGAPLQKVSDSLTTYFLDCQCYGSIRREAASSYS